MAQSVVASQMRAPHLAPTPPGKGEQRVQQYGPEWQAHIAAGGRVRNGNILLPLPRKKAKS